MSIANLSVAGKIAFLPRLAGRREWAGTLWADARSQRAVFELALSR